MAMESVALILQKDLESIYFGNLNTVDADLTLPTQGESGSVFTWKSGEERFITAEGKVHRPLHGMGNRKVILTVTAFYMEETAERTFEATVIQEAKETIVTWVRPVKVTAPAGQEPELPSVVIVKLADGRTTTLPVSWEKCTEENCCGELSGTGVTHLGRIQGTDLTAEAIVEFVEEMPVPEIPEAQYHFHEIGEVRLLPGNTWQEYQQRMNEYLLSVNDDSLLYNFRKACGLDTRGAEPMTGWDTETGNLRGHTTGHYLSGLALAWAATGEEAFLRKIQYMVEGLAECQQAFADSGLYHEGFLSAYSEEQFDLLEVYTKYPEIWAPYYTLDKIMSGLYDCYQLVGMEQALEIECKMGDWVYNRLSRLPKAQLDRMWSMYIAGEYGGMLGTMVKLYELTGKETYLAAAKLFLNEKLFYPMQENVDTLEDMHGNQHIPQIIGAADLYRATGEQKYLDIAMNFWKICIGDHTYTVGGMGETEMFHRAKSTCSYLTEKAAESCASYNLIRLAGSLVPYAGSPAGGVPDASFFDYIENTMENHILTSCSHTADGGTIYFLPLCPGGQKIYSTEENTCCHGTGMESRYRYMGMIYGEDEACLYVNLLVPSVLWRRLKLTEIADGIYEITAHRGEKKLMIRIPSWAEGRAKVTVNGAEIKADLFEGYLEIPEETFEEGHNLHEVVAEDGQEELLFSDEVKIRLELPQELRVVENNSDAGFINVAYGGRMLAAVDEREEFLKAPSLAGLVKSGSGREVSFSDGQVKMIPLHRVDLEKYHVYFRR